MNINTTQALYLIKLIDVLREMDQPVGEILTEAHLGQADLTDRERYIPIEKYLAAVEIAVSTANIPDLGFRVAEHTHTLEHGVVGYAILSSATFREGLQRYVRYQNLQGPLLRISLEEDGETARLRARPLSKEWQMSDGALRYFVQEWLVTMRDWAGMIDGIEKLFSNVSLTYSQSVDPQIYQNYLACPIEFDQPMTQVVFPSRFLDLSMDCGNKAIGNLCQVQCEGLLENLRKRDGLAAEIRKYLSNTLNQVPTMEEMGNILCMSARTLRRRLEAEGLTYQQLVSDYRINMAKHYLMETDMSASGIAELVGYANSPNFYRAFAKETGFTPKEFRLRGIS